ncbi:hypothetical protein Ndes2437B_g00863 [Nannochloris sp. 'desiccata']
MKVYVISDVHSDHKENMEWVEAHCAATSRQSDVLIVAGDVSDDLTTLRKTLQLLSSSYGYCFFCLGNHELWTRKAELPLPSSNASSQNQDVAQGVWIVPIWSWYHADWDQEPDIPGALPIERVMMDFHACTWTSEPTLDTSNNSIARYFDALNDPLFGQILEEINKDRSRESEDALNDDRILLPKNNGEVKEEEEKRKPGRSQPAVISFSHFLPLQDLLPEKTHAALPKPRQSFRQHLSSQSCPFFETSRSYIWTYPLYPGSSNQ